MSIHLMAMPALHYWRIELMVRSKMLEWGADPDTCDPSRTGTLDTPSGLRYFLLDGRPLCGVNRNYDLSERGRITIHYKV